ncbi:urease accessory protein UreF [Sedimentitalea sp.]|uniref:urease accessory protein UreF n=1 Tax=Sedimentitalea sp. TaxID=2048915 RepID=UPI0032984777
MGMAAPIPMPTDTAALLTLAQWLSPSYPVGAFSYSHGLEWAVECGDVSDAPSFQGWLTDILTHGSGQSDAILLATAYGASDAATIAEIDATARALAPSRERLMETTLQGTAFAILTSDIWPAPLSDLCYPVAIGAAARMLGLPLGETLAMYLHAFAGNLTSAAIRLVPLGQTEGQAALAAVAPLCETLAITAQTQTLDDIGSCCFAADIASMKHETQYSRLFRS